MVARAGSSSDKAVSRQSSPAVRALSFQVLIKCLIVVTSDVSILSSWFAGLSGELQTVLRMMLAPKPCERPTVSELLALSSVRKRRWKRRIYLMFAEITLTLASICQVGGYTLIFGVQMMKCI